MSEQVAPVYRLSVAQAETLLEWRERTESDHFYDYHEVFPEQNNQDNGRRRVMRLLVERGVLRTDERGRIRGGTPIPISQGGPTCMPPNSPRYLRLIPDWYRKAHR